MVNFFEQSRLFEIWHNFWNHRMKLNKAGAELCQAQIKLVLAKVGTSLHFPEHFRLSSI